MHANRSPCVREYAPTRIRKINKPQKKEFRNLKTKLPYIYTYMKIMKDSIRVQNFFAHDPNPMLHEKMPMLLPRIPHRQRLSMHFGIVQAWCSRVYA